MLAIPMMRARPIQLIVVGFILVMLAWVLPFLMLLHVIPSTFALDFFSYAAGLVGLFMGIIGAASYYSIHKRRN
jgi:hypothetical protein